MQPTAVIFDLFGTLLEIGSLRTEVAPFVSDPEAFVATWREKQIGYAFASAIIGNYRSFDELTRLAALYAARKDGTELTDWQLEHLVGAWSRVQPYSDAFPTLAALRARGLRCGVLTNGTPATARAALAHAGLSTAIDDLLSVESVQVYKPDRRVYTLATTHYGVGAEQLIFVTSNGWDATGGAEFGFRVAWCNRLGAPHETFGAPPAWTIPDLHALAGVVA